jgi:hypothetical protein
MKNLSNKQRYHFIGKIIKEITTQICVKCIKKISILERKVHAFLMNKNYKD